eukprot:COSAG01_NODE_75876_length_192_cov_22.881720_1_plen_54_part_01
MKPECAHTDLVALTLLVQQPADALLLHDDSANDDDKNNHDNNNGDPVPEAGRLV